MGIKSVFLSMAIAALIFTGLAEAVPYTEKVFDGFVLEGPKYLFPDGKNFTVEFANEDKLIANTNEGRIIVQNNTCKIDLGYNICFKGYSFSHYNYSLNNVVVNKALILIEINLAKINISRNISDTMITGHEYKIRTVFQNVADKEAEGVTFYDQFPSEFDAYTTSDCNILLNNITWKGRLEPNEKVQCTYTVRPLKNLTFISRATIDYHNGQRNSREEAITTITVNPYPLEIEHNVSSVTELGSEIPIDLNLRSKKNISIEYFTINIPKELKIMKSDNSLTRTDNTLILKGQMGDNESIAINNRVLAQFSGNYTIKASARFSYDGLTDSIETNIPINITFKELYARIGRTSFESGKGKLSVFIVNPSNHTFYDLSFNARGMISGNQSEVKIEGLSHKEYAYEFEREPGAYNVSTILRYKSEYYQKFIDTRTFSITINNTSGLQEPSTKQERKKEEAPEKENSMDLDIKKEINQAKTISIIFGVSAVAIIILAIAAAKLKGKEKKPEQKPDPQDLNELIK
ncbi:hypothetical protein HYU11_01560 [Candidatus Woesearchaeota archaeon]|nr:hypothetical protein [Candidatus Woesearchaeota archaeon]